MSYYDDHKFGELVGKTLLALHIDQSNDVITFLTTDGGRYQLYHRQDCCESVYIKDVVGEPEDLLGTPLLMAEERTSDTGPGEEPVEDDGWGDTHTWTFYTLRTIKGTVDISWYGSSNGYYSESVDFEKLPDDEKPAAD